MGWRDLLATEETVVLPWTGGRTLNARSRGFILNRLPQEHGWYSFTVKAKKAWGPKLVDPETDDLAWIVSGYLVGDRLVADSAQVDTDPAKIVENSEKVFLISDGLDRFARVRAGRVYPEGPLIFIDLEFPMGPEDAVMEAYLDKGTVDGIPGVVPALEAAFRMEMHQRDEVDRKRRELLERRAAEEAVKAKAEKRKELMEKLGDGEGRRAMARENFQEAAKAALMVGGAQYLDHRKGQRGEWVVKYRVDGQRRECVCDIDLRIVDAGICLVDHNTDEKGDTYFTLESLPAVIRQAVREGKLVVWRHV